VCSAPDNSLPENLMGFWETIGAVGGRGELFLLASLCLLVPVLSLLRRRIHFGFFLPGPSAALSWHLMTGMSISYYCWFGGGVVHMHVAMLILTALLGLSAVGFLVGAVSSRDSASAAAVLAGWGMCAALAGLVAHGVDLHMVNLVNGDFDRAGPQWIRDAAWVAMALVAALGAVTRMWRPSWRPEWTAQQALVAATSMLLLTGCLAWRGFHIGFVRVPPRWVDEQLVDVYESRYWVLESPAGIGFDIHYPDLRKPGPDLATIDVRFASDARGARELLDQMSRESRRER